MLSINSDVNMIQIEGILGIQSSLAKNYIAIDDFSITSGDCNSKGKAKSCNIISKAKTGNRNSLTEIDNSTGKA